MNWQYHPINKCLQKTFCRVAPSTTLENADFLRFELCLPLPAIPSFERSPLCHSSSYCQSSFTDLFLPATHRSPLDLLVIPQGEQGCYTFSVNSCYYRLWRDVFRMMLDSANLCSVPPARGGCESNHGRYS